MRRSGRGQTGCTASTKDEQQQDVVRAQPGRGGHRVPGGLQGPRDRSARVTFGQSAFSQYMRRTDMSIRAGSPLGSPPSAASAR
jgi:hypothetical protein